MDFGNPVNWTVHDNDDENDLTFNCDHDFLP